MPAYSSRYKRLHNIEWFFECCGYRVHAVSNAGEIPFKIDRDVNMRLQFDMEEMPDIIGDEEIYVNEEYIRYRMQMIGNIREGAFEDYVYGFKRMARKGFYSFDRDITLGEESRTYALIAAPRGIAMVQGMRPLDLPQLVNGSDLLIRDCRYLCENKIFYSWCFEV